jgi:hypothetical protein
VTNLHSVRAVFSPEIFQQRQSAVSRAVVGNKQPPIGKILGLERRKLQRQKARAVERAKQDGDAAARVALKRGGHAGWIAESIGLAQSDHLDTGVPLVDGAAAST